MVESSKGGAYLMLMEVAVATMFPSLRRCHLLYSSMIEAPSATWVHTFKTAGGLGCSNSCHFVQCRHECDFHLIALVAQDCQ